MAPEVNRSDESGAIRAGDLLAFAIVLGLVAGALDLAVVYADRYLFGKLFSRAGAGAWMTPLGYMVMLAAIAAIGLLIRRVFGRHFGRVAVGVLGFVAGFSVLINYVPRLHPVALFVVTVGLAVGMARLMMRSPRSAFGWCRRLAPIAVGLVALTAASMLLWERRVDLGFVGRPAVSHRGPNVLLIVQDAVRAANLSTFGYPKPTSPRLDQLARNGVKFDFAISASSWTSPSHATLFTGRFMPEHSADWVEPMNDSVPTLSEVLSDRGYATGGFTGNMSYAGRNFGFGRGFQTFDDFPVQVGVIADQVGLLRYLARKPGIRAFFGTEQPLSRRYDDDVVDSFLAWSGRHRDRPFFSFINLHDAHDPYVRFEPYATQFDTPLPKDSFRRRIGGLIYGYRAQPTIGAYDASIAWQDHELGRLLDGLARRGQLDSTIVIVTADHGEEFKEHGVYSHGANLYLLALHVPLVISYPAAVPKDISVSRPVSLRDVPATILDLLDLADSRIPGGSLAWGWGQGAPPPVTAGVYSFVSYFEQSSTKLANSRGDLHSLVMDSLHLILNGDGVEEVYRFREDPLEATEVSKALSADTLAALRAELARLRVVAQGSSPPKSAGR